MESLYFYDGGEVVGEIKKYPQLSTIEKLAVLQTVRKHNNLSFVILLLFPNTIQAE